MKKAVEEPKKAAVRRKDQERPGRVSQTAAPPQTAEICQRLETIHDHQRLASLSPLDQVLEEGES